MSLTNAEKRTLHSCADCGHNLGSHDGGGCIHGIGSGDVCPCTNIPVTYETTYEAVELLLAQERAK